MGGIKKVFLSGLLSAAIFAQGPVTASAFRNLDKGEKLFCTNLCKIRLGLEAGQRKLILKLNKKGVENSQAALNGILKMETNNLTKLNIMRSFTKKADSSVNEANDILFEIFKKYEEEYSKACPKHPCP